MFRKYFNTNSALTQYEETGLKIQYNFRLPRKITTEHGDGVFGVSRDRISVQR
jgi:hypothetical protein